MRDLCAQGQTAVFTTHDPNVAAATADYVVLMRQGRVLYAGATGTVLTGEHLTATYDAPIEVLQDSRGRLLVVVY